MHLKFTFAVSFGLLLAAAPAALQAACPAGFAFLDLKTGAAANTLGANVSFHVFPGVVSGAPNTCTQANIVVEYEGTPKLWSLNLGDSPTNDGHAGDAGTTKHEAEAWILGQ